MASEEESRLTADEAEQYDRQIRLWGLDAQKRLRGSSVLVVGMRGLAAEVCKNLVLAGVKALTILDPCEQGPRDRANRFLVFNEGENRALQAVPRLQLLNPNVRVEGDRGRVEGKPDEFFARFSVVCATCCTTETQLRLNEVCRRNGVKFFSGDTWGYYGYCFSDLGSHDYALEVPKDESENDVTLSLDGPRPKRRKRDGDIEMVTVKKSCCFCSLKDALSVEWPKKPPRYFKRFPPTFFIVRTLQSFKDRHKQDPLDSDSTEELLALRSEVLEQAGLPTELIGDSFASHCYEELSPVCAIVGGVLGQEIIKAISCKDIPLRNCFLYDGLRSTGVVEALEP